MKSGPTKPIPVRLNAQTRSRLAAAARKLGSNASAIIRFAIVNQLPAIERGEISLFGKSTKGR